MEMTSPKNLHLPVSQAADNAIQHYVIYIEQHSCGFTWIETILTFTKPTYRYNHICPASTTSQLLGAAITVSESCWATTTRTTARQMLNSFQWTESVLVRLFGHDPPRA
eukprot:6228507-Amphidinium_carterae.2